VRGRDGTCQDRAKTIRCDGEVGSSPGESWIAFLGCQKHLAGFSILGRLQLQIVLTEIRLMEVCLNEGRKAPI
jgi:hypothetical protein